MDDDDEVHRTGVSFNPHYGTMTETGKSHFARSADGLSEFIDNSIQACREVKDSRTIEIGVYFNDLDNSGYMVIADNGKGMDLKTVSEFATYALDRKTRGFEVTDDTSISKFGVGAKQAGFYLGTRMRVVTKESGIDDVHELILDEKEFKSRFDQGLDVYVGNIDRRRVNAFNDHIVPEDELKVAKLQEAMATHENNNESFTIVVIKLRRSIVLQLLKDQTYMSLADELAEIYHFHMHPEHHPSQINQLKQFESISAGSNK